MRDATLPRDATITATPARARSRRPPGDPDHHLWRNGRRWWIAFTLRLPSGGRRRVRRSLGTRDRLEARRRRDEIFARARASLGVELVGPPGNATGEHSSVAELPSEGRP